ncbi:MAG: response regulator [Candidatus Omnitrophica bacterium]|nr:response regulator [Candidatus Omnitrophota bacterium]
MNTLTDNATKQIKVLMAEDEPEVLSIMSKKVAAQGYTVITARDGEEAWEKIQKESPDVIVLDLIMPKRNGFEVLRSVRERPASGHWQPVIIVSAKRDPEDLREGYALEADHYITKPCQIEDILRSIKLMIRLIPQHKRPSGGASPEEKG